MFSSLRVVWSSESHLLRYTHVCARTWDSLAMCLLYTVEKHTFFFFRSFQHWFVYNVPCTAPRFILLMHFSIKLTLKLTFRFCSCEEGFLKLFLCPFFLYLCVYVHICVCVLPKSLLCPNGFKMTWELFLVLSLCQASRSVFVPF